MDCPKCKLPMMIVEFEGVELDHCAKCEGTWFDQDELDLLFENMGPEAQGLLPRDFASMPEAPTDEEKRRCPTCGKRMKKILIELGDGILIDACPMGHGLWFDANEVEELGAALEDATSEAAGGVVHFMGRAFGARKNAK